MAELKKVVAYLDRLFDVGSIPDSSNNGLQVENSGRVSVVCCGVDASMEFFREAARRGANLVVCHHGLSWGDSLKRITDLNYRRIAFLIRHDMALYGCHLPLDAHPRYGNNALICKALGLRRLRPFGLHGSTVLGFQGVLPQPMPYARFKKHVARTIGGSFLKTMDFGPKTVRTVAVVSGGAAGEIQEAGQKGLDVYLSGEPALNAYSLAQEYGVNGVFAGHYATEVFGVQAIGRLLGGRFGVRAEFVDLGVPF